MNTDSHQKHAKLERPNVGEFGRNEFAIIGTPCGKIQKLARGIIEELSGSYRMAYVDADHQSADGKAPGKDSTMLDLGAHLEYTDKISHHRFETNDSLNLHHYRKWMNACDSVLVNGNHFKAQRQIVVIDPKKEESLSRKLDRLDNVVLILLDKGVKEVYGFLEAHLGDLSNIPVMPLSDTERIGAWFKGQLQRTIAPVRGLVLAGGKSQRMGRDKGGIDYHGMPQREYMAEQMSQLGIPVHLSVREDQLGHLDSEFPVLTDSFLGLGPFGAILSAFREDPNSAWMVSACDLPLLSSATLDYLLVNRDPSRVATAFNSPVNQFPEPLIAIWEPRSYPILLDFLAQGYSCPRKVLINSDVHLIDAPNPDALRNINNPDELDELMKELNPAG